jgi:iron-hydrogenase subunit gamma
MEKKIIENILTKYPNAKRDKLIPIMQEVQEELGYISKEAIRNIGSALKLPASKIYGVATFYNQFRFSKIGKYHVMVCRGTACHVKGSAAVLLELEQALKVQSGETTKDGLFTLEVVACIGACGLAPVISVNGEFFANLQSGDVKKIIKDFKQKEKLQVAK